jgi:hypothetical protein
MSELQLESKETPPRVGWVLYDGGCGFCFPGFTSGKRQLVGGVLPSKICNPLGRMAACKSRKSIS